MQADTSQVRGLSTKEEMERENHEKQLKAKQMNSFKGFYKKIVDETEGRIDFDVPYHNLGFQGDVMMHLVRVFIFSSF